MQIFTFNRNLLSNNACNATYFQQENTVSKLRAEKQKKEGELCTCIKINLICMIFYVNRFIFSRFHMYITFQYVHYFVYFIYFCVRPCLFPALIVSFVQLFQKSYCDKTNLVLFAISAIIILFKQLQMIWDCITSFKMCQSSCQSLCLCLWKIWISHYDGVVLPIHHFWNFSR